MTPRANPYLGKGGLHRECGKGSWVPQCKGFREHFLSFTWIEMKTELDVKYPGSDYKYTLVPAAGGAGPTTGLTAGGERAVSSLPCIIFN